MYNTAMESFKKGDRVYHGYLGAGVVTEAVAPSDAAISAVGFGYRVMFDETPDVKYALISVMDLEHEKP
jgi:hypothetical protein